MKCWYLVVPAIILHTSECAKILGLFPFPSKSHYLLAKRLMIGLAEKGNDVTILSPHEETDVPQNISYTNIPFKLPLQGRHNLFVIDEMNYLTYNLFMSFLGNSHIEAVFNSSALQQILNSNRTFDVVIMEQFINDGMKVVAHHFNAHLVLFGTFGSSNWINPLVGNPAPPSYIAEQNIHFKPEYFFHRVKNYLYYLTGLLVQNLIFYPAQDKLVKKYFPNAPDLEDLQKNISLVLLNSHYSTSKALPRVPNMVDIGGFHLTSPKKLPEDLQNYLDNSKNGVVYFSMGSNLQSVNLPEEKRKALLNVFSRLNENVLWKWEDDVMPDQPPNVKLSKWLPQQDILAHPNIKAFVTHGGLLSFIESVYHGIPLLAIPVYGDQIYNALEIAGNDCGRYIIYRDLEEKNLEEALSDVLRNTKYRENMQKRSKIMRDRRSSAIEDADYWIKYVIRHGATHLRVSGIDLPWYQYLSLDVIAFLVVCLWLSLHLLYIVLRKLIGACCSKNQQKIKLN